MKARRLTWTLLWMLLGGAVISLPAQPSEAARERFEGKKVNAEKGDATAQFYLGMCYDIGNGVKKDRVEAAKWYRKAADQGHVAAQHALGLLYGVGDGVAKDSAEALRWYR